MRDLSSQNVFVLIIVWSTSIGNKCSQYSMLSSLAWFLQGWFCPYDIDKATAYLILFSYFSLNIISFKSETSLCEFPYTIAGYTLDSSHLEDNDSIKITPIACAPVPYVIKPPFCPRIECTKFCYAYVNFNYESKASVNYFIHSCPLYLTSPTFWITASCPSDHCRLSSQVDNTIINHIRTSA